jgi:hypothetical protein
MPALVPTKRAAFWVVLCASISAAVFAQTIQVPTVGVEYDGLSYSILNAVTKKDERSSSVGLIERHPFKTAQTSKTIEVHTIGLDGKFSTSNTTTAVGRLGGLSMTFRVRAQDSGPDSLFDAGLVSDSESGGTQQVRYYDTFLVTSPSLPPGTLVKFKFLAKLSSFATATGWNTPGVECPRFPVNGQTKTFVILNFQITPGMAPIALNNASCAPAAPFQQYPPITDPELGEINVRVGEQYLINLSVNLEGWGMTFVLGQRVAQVYSNAVASLTLDPVTADVGYVTLSGLNYRSGADIDGDGIATQSDNCPLDANATQKDTDGDGVGNKCDADDEADDVPDEFDNCPKKPNQDQINTDGDAKGDACDPDDDNDGIKDTRDNCPLVKNPDQKDTDGDGIGDACEPTRSLSSWRPGSN